MMKIKYRLWWVAMLAVTVCLVAACGGPRKVSVTTVQDKSVPISLSTDANVTALNKAVVEPKVSGRVDSFAVKVGDTVREGQVLATIDMTELKAQLSKAAQGMAVAPAPAAVDNADVERARGLLQSGVITMKEFQRIQGRYGNAPVPTAANVAATASQAAMEAQLAEGTVRAPMAGVVTAIYNEDRKIALQGRPFMMIQQESPMVASITVPGSVAHALLGQAVRAQTEVTITTPKGVVRGLITYVDPTATQLTPAALVKVTFDNKDHFLKAGEFYTVHIASKGQATMKVIPASAVHTTGKDHTVYVVTKDGHVDVKAVVISTLPEDKQWVVVMSGLSQGEQVITTPGTFTLGESVVITS